MSVTRIDEHHNHDTVEALRDLLRKAEAGQLRGLGFVVKVGLRRHRIGFTGDYLDDPVQVLGCVTRMEYKVNQLISSRDSEPETRSMPL